MTSALRLETQTSPTSLRWWNSGLDTLRVFIEMLNLITGQKAHQRRGVKETYSASLSRQTVRSQFSTSW
jgi:hypothetical protein